MVRGIDVSSYQGKVDWPEVAKHVDFAICKASEGPNWIDPTFDANWHGIHAAGLIRGAYHFARPSPISKPEHEADHFVDTIRRAGGLRAGDLPPIIDVEASKFLTKKQLRLWVARFLVQLRTRTGRAGVIYTGAWFWDAKVAPGQPLGPLWVASYTKQPLIPRDWQRSYKLWQFTDHLPIPGVAGAVDASCWNGTLEELHTFAGLAPKKPVHHQRPLQRPVLRLGASGPDVRALQRALVGHGFIHLPVDGRYGDRTQNAVKGIQHTDRLTVDGVVGPATWRALGL